MKQLLLEDHNFRILQGCMVQFPKEWREVDPVVWGCHKNHVENLCCFIPQSIFLWGPLQAPWCAMSTSLYTRRVIVGGASGIARSYCRSGAGNMAGFCYREGVRRWRLFCCGGCDLFLSSRLFVVDVLSRSCKFEFQNFMKRLLNNWKWAK